jgi:disulfide bond formation protein DsbB
MKSTFAFSWLQLSFLAATVGTFGSLYFSEILKYPPCVLCWYQRICLYPLVIIFGTAIWSNDSKYKLYAMPLIVLGLLIALYHNLIYYGFVAEALTPCTEGISCSSKQLELGGFITIPLLSLFGFATLAFLTAMDRAKGTSDEK